MYTIIELGNGKYRCEGKLQDSTERWDEDSLEEAIKSMKEFAKFGNGVKIKKKDIVFLRAVQVVKTEYQQFKP